MVEISNIKVYDIPDSIVASGYAMGKALEDFDGRVKNLEYWLSLGDFLPSFTKHYNNQGKDLGQNTKESCKKCGSNHRVQKVRRNGDYYCGKHSHILYRYGEIIDPITYSFLPENKVEIRVLGDKNNVKRVVISSIDVPLVFGKHLKVDPLGYLRVDGKMFHRILAEKLGYNFEQVDHIDRNPANNSRENLRPCTAQDNIRNRGKTSDDIVGISYRKDRKKWRAYITVDGKQIPLGSYDKKEDAIKSRLKKEAEIFGSFSPNIALFQQYCISIPKPNAIENNEQYSLELAYKDFQRMARLSSAKMGSGHSNALKGVRVSFDIKYPGYFTPELQRYNFVDIVTSSSKMHRLVQMDMDTSFNKYVSEYSKNLMRELIEDYNREPSYENFMAVVSNCPMGLELFMRCSTNYLQLKTIYRQRKGHKLKEDWGAFLSFIEDLPYAKELIIELENK